MASMVFSPGARPLTTTPISKRAAPHIQGVTPVISSRWRPATPKGVEPETERSAGPPAPGAAPSGETRPAGKYRVIEEELELKKRSNRQEQRDPLDQLDQQSQREDFKENAVARSPFADAARVAHAAEQAHLAALVTRCLGGDAVAWETLVRREQRRVYGLCFRFTGSPSDAEELTQDVFLKVYRNLGSFDAAKAGFGIWLTALTRNLLVDYYRRSRLERATESLDEPVSEEGDGQTHADRLPDRGKGQEQHVAGLELRARVQAALAQVTPELREAVILRDLEDLDYREIADVLGIPQGTVKSRISRGRAELARLLHGAEGQVV